MPAFPEPDDGNSREGNTEEEGDEQKFTFLQACGLNTMNMFGTGPLITIPYCLQSVDPVGPHCMVGYAVACFACLCDSFVWAEIGSIWPRNGGSYTYLKQLYGEDSLGQLMGFMFIWQFLISGPAELASGYIAIAEYMLYIVDTNDYWIRVYISLGLCFFTSLLLCRKISEVGCFTLFLWSITIFAMIFTLVCGFWNYDQDYLKSPPGVFDDHKKLIWSIAAATRFGIYDMTGYYDVCSFGGDCKDPRRTIPKSVVTTCFIVGIIYILVYVAVLGAMNYKDYVDDYADDADESPFGIMSVFTEELFNKTFANIITVIVCITIFGSNFAQLCGYSYLPYAAAMDGNFPSCFAFKTTSGIPLVSLLTISALSIIWCFFSIDVVIDAMTTMLVLVQFIGQSVGLILYKCKHSSELPDDRWKMPCYPIPVLLQIILFGFIFVTTDSYFIYGGDPLLEYSIAFLFGGMLLYFLTAKCRGTWPCGSKSDDEDHGEKDTDKKEEKKGETEMTAVE